MVTMLKVLVVNGQMTPMEFVVSVLEEIFGQSKEEAERTALHAHLSGNAICGIYRQHAEAQNLVRSATARSRLHGFPLGFLIRPLPFWERAAVWLFSMAMKVVPDYRVSPARSSPLPPR
jgi:ATP-dependent Clp protease adapter protein ClpS